MKILVCSLVACCGITLLAAEPRAESEPDSAWTSTFDLAKEEFSSTGRNPHFVLEAGYQLVFEGGDERVVKTVLDETKQVDGVETRIVEERETKGGTLIEVSRNYFAISKRTNSVYYFGEEVDIYKDGKIESHDGAWLSGVDGAKFGLMMPGEVLLRSRFYQEVAPKIALDRAEVISTSETVKTNSGEFKNCLQIRETTPLEPDVSDKYYAAGIGCVQDGKLKLVSHGKPKPASK